MAMYTHTTQRQIRAAFWNTTGQRRKLIETRPGLYRLAMQNEYPADTRAAFCDFVDHLHRSGEISDALADRVTLR
jgi:hypothetical protein